MKTYFLPLILVLFIGVSSCEDIEDNSSVIQATVDSLFFRSFEALGTINSNNNLVMQGLTDNQVITIQLLSNTPDAYELGVDEINYATFEDENGNLYTTAAGGSGEVVIDERCESCGSVSGSFKFTAVLPGVDTLYIDKGIFYNISYGGETDGAPSDAGSLSAKVDSIPFTPLTVTAVDSGNSILVSGATASNNILIRVPVDVTVGNYPLPMTGFQASYTVEGTSEDAQSGNISIVSHDVTAKTIRGSFSFQTENYSITVGQFNVTYE